MAERKTTIQDDQSLPIIKKCALMDVSRSTLYYTPIEQEPDLEELEIKRLMDELHIKHSYMGVFIINNKYKNLVLVVSNMNKENYFFCTFY